MSALEGGAADLLSNEHKQLCEIGTPAQERLHKENRERADTERKHEVAGDPRPDQCLHHGMMHHFSRARRRVMIAEGDVRLRETLWQEREERHHEQADVEAPER